MGVYGGPRCLVGAIASASGRRAEYSPIEIALTGAEWNPTLRALGFPNNRKVSAKIFCHNVINLICAGISYIESPRERNVRLTCENKR